MEIGVDCGQGGAATERSTPARRTSMLDRAIRRLCSPRQTFRPTRPANPVVRNAAHARPRLGLGSLRSRRQAKSCVVQRGLVPVEPRMTARLTIVAPRGQALVVLHNFPRLVLARLGK